ncbi:MAG: TFIIB-type zinc ribbon-containing protein [Desulfurococcales archaeon]|nr:TFIIB-type zinc ribbon-containing protein [Desulfurococcales archaeon]
MVESPKSGAGKSKRKSSKKERKWTVNIEEMTSIVASEVVSRAGLDYLGLKEAELRDVIEPIVASIVEARKTKPTAESIIKRIINSRQTLYKAIAAKLLERDTLSLEQLEFIVTYAPELAGRAAPKLYRIAKELNADYIVDTLRYLWQRYGTPTRVRCPYCGFDSVTPDLTCIVCGRSVEERDLKEEIGFDRLLADLARSGHRDVVEEILRAGFAVYDGEIYPPSLRSRHPYGVILYLTRREKMLLKSLLSREEE